MASRIKKLFEKALTTEEVTDLIESMIHRIKEYEDTTRIMVNDAQSMFESFLAQQADIVELQAQLTLRDYEVDLLTRRVISLEEIISKQSPETSGSNCTS